MGKPSAALPGHAPPLAPRRSRGRLRRWRRKIETLAVVLALYGLVIVVAFDPSARRDNRAAGEPAAGAGEPVNPLWPPDVVFAAHTVPALIKNEIVRPAEQHGYRFTGTAGQTWAITVEPRDGSAFDPLLTLYLPSGGVAVQADDRAAGDFTAETVFVLPENGTYRLLVESSRGGLTTGAYLLALWPR